jgi:protein-S-isoprenylcysteine O-methyltransferase Ste14
MLLVSANWAIGLCFFAPMGLLVVVRIPREERMMTDEFGEQYGAYRARTGAVLPRFW